MGKRGGDLILGGKDPSGNRANSTSHSGERSKQANLVGKRVLESGRGNSGGNKNLTTAHSGRKQGTGVQGKRRTHLSTPGAQAGESSGRETKTSPKVSPRLAWEKDGHQREEGTWNRRKGPATGETEGFVLKRFNLGLLVISLH